MVVENKCYVDGCPHPPSYFIEWYGLNQHGENPLVVCDQLEHQLSLSYHDGYGGVPDEIVNFNNLEGENPSLLEKIIERMK